MFNDPRVGTAAASGVALATVYLIVHTFTYFTGIDVSADYQSALQTVLVALGAMFVHRIGEDQAALHKLILARLGDPQPPQPPQHFGPSVPPAIVIPQRSAAELLGSQNAGQR